MLLAKVRLSGHRLVAALYDAAHAIQLLLVRNARADELRIALRIRLEERRHSRKEIVDGQLLCRSLEMPIDSGVKVEPSLGLAAVLSLATNAAAVGLLWRRASSADEALCYACIAVALLCVVRRVEAYRAGGELEHIDDLERVVLTHVLRCAIRVDPLVAAIAERKRRGWLNGLDFLEGACCWLLVARATFLVFERRGFATKITIVALLFACRSVYLLADPADWTRSLFGCVTLATVRAVAMRLAIAYRDAASRADVDLEHSARRIEMSLRALCAYEA